MRQGFYVVVLLVALAGQVSGAVETLHIPLFAAIPAVGALELGGIVVLANADVRRRLGERAVASRLLSVAIAGGAVAFNWLAHADHLMGGFFAGMSALGYLVWLMHTENQRRDRLRAKGDLPPTTPAYEVLEHWLRHPWLTHRAKSLAKAHPELGLYDSLAAARAAVRRERRQAAISKVLHRKIRAAVDPNTADIALAVYDLDEIADRLARGADYDGLTALIAADLAPARLAASLGIDPTALAALTANSAPALPAGPGPVADDAASSGSGPDGARGESGGARGGSGGNAVSAGSAGGGDGALTGRSVRGVGDGALSGGSGRAGRDGALSRGSVRVGGDGAVTGERSEETRNGHRSSVEDDQPDRAAVRAALTETTAERRLLRADLLREVETLGLGRAGGPAPRTEPVEPAAPRGEPTVPAGRRGEPAASAGGRSEPTASAGRRDEQTVPAGRRGEETVPAGRRGEETVPAGRRDEETVPAGRRGEPPVSAGRRGEQAVPAARRAESVMRAARGAESVVPVDADPDAGRVFGRGDAPAQDEEDDWTPRRGRDGAGDGPVPGRAGRSGRDGGNLRRRVHSALDAHVPAGDQRDDLALLEMVTDVLQLDDKDRLSVPSYVQSWRKANSQ